MKPADVSWPAPAAHPPVVGGYLVQGVRSGAESGSVLDATVSGSGSEEVLLVLLSTGAGHDGAARDRFSQAVEQVARDGHLLDAAGLTERPPWVALTPQAADDGTATRLLHAVLPPDADEHPRAGPRFRLPWFTRGWGVTWAPWLGTKAPPGWRRLWWLVGVLALLAILGLLLSMCQAPAPSQPGPSGPSSPSQSDTSPEPTQTPSQSPQTGSPSPGQPQEGEGGSSNARRA